MARINNPETIKRMLDDAGVQTSHDDVPTQLASKVVPVLISNPSAKYKSVVVRGAKATTGTQTIYTTPTDKDFFVTSVYLSFTCDVSADSTTYNVYGIAGDGTSVNLLEIKKETLTAMNDHENISFPVPIKIKRNSVIGVGQAFTVGTSTIVGIITGFTA